MIETMTPIQYAWIIYGAGSLGCAIAAWWMFLWAWRFVRYSMVATVLVILCTPYAIDPQTMVMAPAIYTIVFEGLAMGLDSIKPLIKLMVGIWLIAIILVLMFVLLTRRPSYTESDDPKARRTSSKQKRISNTKRKTKEHERPYDRHLTREERQARSELLEGEVPIRALRD